LLFSSSTATGTEFTVSGVVILVTMTGNKTEETGLDSRFALRFLRSQNDFVFPPERILYPTSFVTGEGHQTLSFPENNAVDYENNANHLMIISRGSGRDFNITQTFQDTEEGRDYIWAFGIKYDADKTRFRYEYE